MIGMVGDGLTGAISSSDDEKDFEKEVKEQRNQLKREHDARNMLMAEQRMHQSQAEEAEQL